MEQNAGLRLADDRVDSVGWGGGQTGVAAVERTGGEGDTQCGRLTVGQLLRALLHRQILTGGVGGGNTETVAGVWAGTDGVPGVVPVLHRAPEVNNNLPILDYTKLG